MIPSKLCEVTTFRKAARQKQFYQVPLNIMFHRSLNYDKYLVNSLDEVSINFVSCICRKDR